MSNINTHATTRTLRDDVISGGMCHLLLGLSLFKLFHKK